MILLLLRQSQEDGVAYYTDRAHPSGLHEVMTSFVIQLDLFDKYLYGSKSILSNSGRSLLHTNCIP